MKTSQKPQSSKSSLSIWSPIIIAKLLTAILRLLIPTGCGTLDPSGVYKGDAVLYRSELGINTSYELIHTFVEWELDNRAALARWPEIRKAADDMRKNTPRWKATADAMHDAYAAYPSDTNREALTKALNILKTAMTEATKYMAKPLD